MKVYKHMSLALLLSSAASTALADIRCIRTVINYEAENTFNAFSVCLEKKNPRKIAYFHNGGKEPTTCIAEGVYVENKNNKKVYINFDKGVCKNGRTTMPTILACESINDEKPFQCRDQHREYTFEVY